MKVLLQHFIDQNTTSWTVIYMYTKKSPLYMQVSSKKSMPSKDQTLKGLFLNHTWLTTGLDQYPTLHLKQFHLDIQTFQSQLLTILKSSALIRVVLFDFCKAFDLIDHNILVRKLSDYNITKQMLCWIADFLSDRRQRVKLAQDCFSEWRYIGCAETIV